MTKSQAGLKGALATRRKFGIGRCPTCGRLKLTGFYRENGKKGGETTKKLYGNEFYSQIGRLGGRGKKRDRKTK